MPCSRADLGRRLTRGFNGTTEPGSGCSSLLMLDGWWPTAMLRRHDLVCRIFYFIFNNIARDFGVAIIIWIEKLCAVAYVLARVY